MQHRCAAFGRLQATPAQTCKSQAGCSCCLTDSASTSAAGLDEAGRCGRSSALPLIALHRHGRGLDLRHELRRGGCLLEGRHRRIGVLRRPPTNNDQPLAGRTMRALARNEAGCLATCSSSSALSIGANPAAAIPGLSVNGTSSTTLPPSPAKARWIANVANAMLLSKHFRGFLGASVRQNLPFAFFHSVRGGMFSIESQCSAILPFSTLKRS
jgi:hypothetical protein